MIFFLINLDADNINNQNKKMNLFNHSLRTLWTNYTFNFSFTINKIGDSPFLL